MGQVVSSEESSSSSSAAQPGTVGAGFLGIFGTGKYKVFLTSGTFVVPAGVTRIRVRVVGAGGGGGSTATPGPAGGATSFGALISATGGQGGISGQNNGTANGGVGIGGDFQAVGGSVTKDGTINGYGGGAAGSQLGNGGTSFNRGGGAVGGIPTKTTYGASPFGLPSSTAPAPDSAGYVNPTYINNNSVVTSPVCPPKVPNRLMRFPFDFFDGGAGVIYAQSGGNAFFIHSGSGAGGSMLNAFSQIFVCDAGIGGGGASCSSNQGQGGIGGGGGGEYSGAAGGGAGGGYADGEFTVIPGVSYTVTIGQAGNPIAGKGGDGLSVVEW